MKPHAKDTNNNGLTPDTIIDETIDSNGIKWNLQTDDAICQWLEDSHVRMNNDEVMYTLGQMNIDAERCPEIAFLYKTQYDKPPLCECTKIAAHHYTTAHDIPQKSRINLSFTDDGDLSMDIETDNTGNSRETLVTFMANGVTKRQYYLIDVVDHPSMHMEDSTIHASFFIENVNNN
jgi:hypothetical protein